MQTDAYLSMAESVLRRTRRPMSTKQILKDAFLSGTVPPNLHGRTQHKTLGARLSEDILDRRNRSKFFRVRPGRFFLTEFMRDETLPEDYRVPYIAKRRARELQKEYVAYLVDGSIKPSDYNKCLAPKTIKRLIQRNAVAYHRFSPERGSGLDFYAFAVVRRGDEILTYQRGSYREQRSEFVGRRTIGFTTPVCHDDYTLFDYEDHGAVTAALTAVAIDLDLEFTPEFTRFEEDANLRFCIPITDAEHSSFVAVVEVKAPKDYRLQSKRLAINDMEWVPISTAKDNRAAFDPWSATIIEKIAAGC
jgi:hypothetical protein